MRHETLAVPRTGAVHAVATFVDNVVGTIGEWAVAALVVAEIVILFAGVVSRYVFQEPILWSDELASILFLWLAMLGAVVALRRGEHMRMTAIVGMVSPRWRAFLDVFAMTARWIPGRIPSSPPRKS